MKHNDKARKKGRRTVKAYFKESERDDRLGKLAKKVVGEWYNEKHPKAGPDEIALINLIEITSCPRCGSTDIVRKGKTKSGVARYLCNGCHRTFSPLTGTLLSCRKIPISERFEFLVNLCSYESVSQSALTNMNAQSTGSFWMKVIFSALKGCQDSATLGGRVYVDETYFKETPAGSFLVCGRKPRGLSKNLWCVATARDEEDNCCLVVCGKGKPDSERLVKALLPHIKKGSTVIHDGENSHAELVAAVGGDQRVYKTERTKGLSDAKNPLDHINEMHSYLKRFMASHGGYGRDSLQDWLNLFYMVFTSFGDPSVFAFRVMELLLKTKKTVRYRKVMSKKAS